MSLKKARQHIECDVVRTLYALIDKTCHICGEPLEKFEFLGGYIIYICKKESCGFYSKEQQSDK
jgi:hypothetical protein